MTAQSAKNNVPEALSEPQKYDPVPEAQKEEEDFEDELLVPAKVATRALPPEISSVPPERTPDSPREVSIDEHIPPALADAVRSMAPADSSTAGVVSAWGCDKSIPGEGRKLLHQTKHESIFSGCRGIHARL